MFREMFQSKNKYYESLITKLISYSVCFFSEFLKMANDEILELSLNTFLTVYREDEFPLELARHLSLEECERLIPSISL